MFFQIELSCAFPHVSRTKYGKIAKRVEIIALVLKPWDEKQYSSTLRYGISGCHAAGKV